MAQAAIGWSRPIGDQRIDGLLFQTFWAGPVTYGFPDARGAYDTGYGIYDEALASFSPLNQDQRLALHSILDTQRHDARQAPGAAGFSVEGFTRLEITFQASLTGSGDGVLRGANSAAVPTAYAYYPQQSFYAGDMWFGGMGADARAGNIDYTAVLHEAGHALGLKHPHETGGFGAVPRAWDSPEFTVMTYRPFAGGATEGSRYPEGDAPQSFMMLDIAALQSLYGADFATNAGNTTYAWDGRTGRSLIDGALAIDPTGRTIFQTIWDGGGRDTYRLSNFDCDLDIDLQPGAASVLAFSNLAWLGGGPNGGYARGSVFNALQYRGDPRSLIENAVGGSGDDTIRGNAAANRLVGGDGADLLNGRGGADVMIGGAGNDRYIADTHLDRMVEMLAGAAGGRDKVVATASLSLGANLETLVLAGRAVSGGGNGEANVLVGNALANNLNGRGGHDVIAGRGGADTLFGAAGRDVFRFFDVSESTPRHFDRIKPASGVAAFEGAGAAPGDRIDLRAIDADEGARGDQAFHFGSAHGAGSLWAKEWRGMTYIRAHVDDDDVFDFQLRIEDGAVRASAYTADDFLL